MTSSNRLIRKQNQAESYAGANFVFSANTPAGWTLSTELAKLGITRRAKIKITINQGVIVGRINLDSAPARSKISIFNYGQIVGPINSGNALRVNVTTRIWNYGTIAGGGGAGGKGGDAQHGGADWAGTNPDQIVCKFQVYPGGAGGNGAGLVGTSIVGPTAGVNGVDATDAATSPGDGGAGGALGQPGQAGQNGIRGNSWPGGTLTNPQGQTQFYPACGPYNGGVWAYGAPGGPAGAAIQGISFVTWMNKGTILGLLT